GGGGVGAGKGKGGCQQGGGDARWGEGGPGIQGRQLGGGARPVRRRGAEPGATATGTGQAAGTGEVTCPSLHNGGTPRGRTTEMPPARRAKRALASRRARPASRRRTRRERACADSTGSYSSSPTCRPGSVRSSMRT